MGLCQRCSSFSTYRVLYVAVSSVTSNCEPTGINDDYYCYQPDVHRYHYADFYRYHYINNYHCQRADVWSYHYADF